MVVVVSAQIFCSTTQLSVTIITFGVALSCDLKMLLYVELGGALDREQSRHGRTVHASADTLHIQNILLNKLRGDSGPMPVAIGGRGTAPLPGPMATMCATVSACRRPFQRKAPPELKGTYRRQKSAARLSRVQAVRSATRMRSIAELCVGAASTTMERSSMRVFYPSVVKKFIEKWVRRSVGSL